ncbi:MAG: VIT and VWA domain-containing protein [Anaeromyxobacteraceae bacterium]
MTSPAAHPLLAVALALVAGAPTTAADPRDRSPSTVLAAADARLGSQQVQFPERARREGADRSLAPYFEVRGDGATERLPLEETKADVQIAGVIARVRVTQTFRNDGRSPIDAIYVFPASTRAAVHGMRVRIGARTIEARIERRAEARAQYEQARQEGKRAALLEQERPNVFTMSVANVMPGDRLAAELDYSELIVPEGGVYELVYPTVVGPRYGGGADPRGDGWVANPYLPKGSAAPYRFGFQAHVESAIGIKEITSPSHRLDVAYGSATSADVKLAGAPAGDKDVVLRWRLAGDRIESGVLLTPSGPDGRDGYFLATVEPPARIATGLIPPREYVFVVDVSGSMHGFPLDTSKALLRSMLPRLRPQDTFNLVFFAGTSWVLSPDRSLQVSDANVRRALAAIDDQRGGGGTELMQALRTAYALPRSDERVARAVVVITDGYVAVEAQAFKLVRERLNEASCFAFGIGSSVNRGLVEALARAGQGEPFVVLSPQKASAAAARLQVVVEQPVLSRLSYRFEGFDAREVAPMTLPDLLAERPLVLFGKWRGEPRGRIVIRGQGANGPVETTIDVGRSTPRAENAPLRVLWARKWVELLDDERHLGPAKEIEEAITDLGLSHRILTAFTSFVAVDSEVVNRTGRSATVKQPLPLPEGVENGAVGQVASGANVARRAMAMPPPASASADSLGMQGRSSGPAAAPEPSPAAPSRKAEEAERKAPTMERERAKEDRVPAQVKATVARIELTDERVERLPDVASLREAVRKAILRAAGGCLAGGRYRLELTLGADGKVVRVKVLAAPDAASKRCLEVALTGLAGGSRPIAGGDGTWAATVRIAR